MSLQEPSQTGPNSLTRRSTVAREVSRGLMACHGRLLEHSPDSCGLATGPQRFHSPRLRLPRRGGARSRTSSTFDPTPIRLVAHGRNQTNRFSDGRHRPHPRACTAAWARGEAEPAERADRAAEPSLRGRRGPRFLEQGEVAAQRAVEVYGEKHNWVRVPRWHKTESGHTVEVRRWCTSPW